MHGQKTFNGVAMLSKLPFDEVTPRLPGDDSDDHARFIEAVVSTDAGALRVASIYLPNGNPPDTEKYTYKIRWMDRLIHYADERLELEEPLVLAGDFNVIPSELDARNPAAWRGDALFLPQTRAEVPRALQSRTDRRGSRRERCGRVSTRSGIIRRAPGRRTTASASTTCCCRRRRPTGSSRAGIDKHVRGWEKPSDHVSVSPCAAVGRNAGDRKRTAQRLKKVSSTFQGSL